MNKRDVQKRVLINGKPLGLKLFAWDEKTRVFSSREDGLVINFSDIMNCTFVTESGCNFKTGSFCTFKTGSGCIFNTKHHCVFDTGRNCIFNTGDGCAFSAENDCTFHTGNGCTIRTISGCVFSTGSNCVVHRVDVFEVIIPVPRKRFKLNMFGVQGFVFLE